MGEQRKQILEQFARQAAPFAEIHRLLIRTAEIGGDEVLDVACGLGLVACEVARVARHVTGIVLTPAMIEQARLPRDPCRKRADCCASTAAAAFSIRSGTAARG